MADDAYLGEEAGRRATGARLLDLIGRFVPGGPAARRRLRPRAAARRGARPRLRDDRPRALARVGAPRPRRARPRRARARPRGLRRRRRPAGLRRRRARRRHRAPRRPGRRRSRRCAALLRPGGVLCVVTPDPSSRDRARRGPALVGLRPRPHLPAAAPDAARAARRRRARRLDRRAARADVLGAALGRGPGRAPRAGGRAGRRRRARACRPGATLSLSLGDERVVLAHRVDGRSAPAEPLVRDRGGADVGARRPARLPRRRARSPTSSRRCPSDGADRALLVDDASGDETADDRARPRPRGAAPPGEPRLRRRAEERATRAR